MTDSQVPDPNAAERFATDWELVEAGPDPVGAVVVEGDDQADLAFDPYTAPDDPELDDVTD